MIDSWQVNVQRLNPENKLKIYDFKIMCLMACFVFLKPHGDSFNPKD
jgi:hypothetical protein